MAQTPAPTTPPSPDPGWRPGTPPLSTPWTDAVGPDNALPEYPRPQLTRDRWHNLNGVWEFAAAESWDSPPVGQPLAERVLVPYPIESALSGIQRTEDRMWYRRTFTVPADWRIGGPAGDRLVLRFGAVDYETRVWVNGVLVTTHRGGYDGFAADITDALVPAGEQELVVGVEDRTDATWQPVGKQRREPDRGIFYTASSGIWQTVWLEPVPGQHITGLDLTPDLAGGCLRLLARTTGGPATVEAVVQDGDREVGRVRGAAGSELRLPVPAARLWSPDSPFLYDLTVRLVDGDRTVDQVGSYFGMREIGLVPGADGRPRLALNGEILFLLSTLDQGFWPDGLHTAPTDEALRFDLEQHKELGFNTVRKHIKVEPDRWFQHADRLGLLVWQDMPAMRTHPGEVPPPAARTQFEAELHAMVDQHASWTSIVVWVPFNEGWGEWDATATGRIAAELTARDPSRLVNAHSGVNCWDTWGDSGRGHLVDHHVYPGPARPAPELARAAVDGEHGGFGLEVAGHLWFGDGHAYEMTPDSATLTRRYVDNQREVLAAARTGGLAAAVYTQLTDVEHEVNGFFTYDRRVRKMDVARVRAINEEIVASADGSTAATEPPPGTGHHYPFAEGTGTTTADAAGDAPGTLVGGPEWTDGRTGPGLRFGAGAFVDTGRALVDTTGSYAVAAWVRLDGLGGFATAVSQDGVTDSGFFLQYSGTHNRFAFGVVGLRALAQRPPEPGRWYHLVGVRDARTATLRLYVDGRQANATPATVTSAARGNTVIGRGRFANTPTDPWQGTIDQVWVFNHALSPEEVARLHAPEPPAGSPVRVVPRER